MKCRLNGNVARIWIRDDYAIDIFETMGFIAGWLRLGYEVRIEPVFA